MGKVVISTPVFVAGIVGTALVIVAVGLLAGLLGKDDGGTSDTVIGPTTTKPDVKTTTALKTTAPMETTSSYPPGPWSNIRLPNSLVPIHYSVDLKPELTPRADMKYYFTGESSVTFNVTESTPYIIIHSNKLAYSSVTVRDEADMDVAMDDFWLLSENQYLIVPLQNEMTAGKKYSLFTTFEGELADDLGGLYRSSYTNKEGNTIVIATTQMQPTDARKAFPCFDEPALKATFDISLWHKDPNFALSNMPNISTESMSDGWKKTSFNRTVKMSTYLLAFVVCDFEYVESFTDDMIQTRIYARRQQIENGNGNYARDITPKILEEFEKFFNVSYPLPKSDQIAVPDFAAGAMENWGLVIYRETALLYDSAINSASNKQRVAVVVAHELAHQWFGNLISPLWWDELWLNEGFASYVEYIGTDFVEPTWRMHDQFVVADLHRAMDVDGLASSRPIVPENINTPAEINSLFDTISYSKGACIIRMINEFTGDEAFKLGLTNYLTEYEYGPVDHNQLFDFWDKAIAETQTGSKPPQGFVGSMDTWMLQMGYPVVMMNREAENVEVTQKRFLLDPAADPTLPTSDFEYQWDVPLWYITSSSDTKRIMWLERNKPETIKINSADDYIIGNYEAFGYYRVNYDDTNWNAITNQLINDHTAIDVRSRGKLIDDAFNLARRGDVSYDIAFGLTTFLVNDFDYIPWESALDVMSYFDLVLGRSKVYGVYSQYLLDLVEPVYLKLTWNDGGSHLEQLQRINAIDTACKYGMPECISEASNLFGDWLDTGNNTISPNLKTATYCHAIANGGDKEWDFAWEKYLNETNSQERSKLEYGLSCTKTPWIIRRFLDYTLNDTYVRKQDASSVLQDLCYNEYARDITWDYIRSRWEYIYEVYGTGFFSFSGIIDSCTSHFSTEFELQELRQFKDDNLAMLGSGLRSVDQAIEKTITNIKWVENYQDDVFTWLSNKVSAP